MLMLGAELQNLLKLFEWIVEDGSVSVPKIDHTYPKSRKIIY
jgi:hypothetical protein